jgi:pilus assembly protein CpaD
MMKKFGIVLPLCLSVVALSACEMYSESIVSDRRLQVREETLSEQIPTARLDKDSIAGLAHKYAKSGKGPVNLTVTYDPESRTNTAMRASNEAARISRVIKKEGAREVTTAILPVREQGTESVTILSYSSYQAFAPKNCGTMPGVDSAVLEHDPDYKLGCTVESVFAKQVANPSDLLGDARSSASSDGRVGSNVVDIYRTGAPNKPLKGQEASD